MIVYYLLGFFILSTQFHLSQLQADSPRVELCSEDESPCKKDMFLEARAGYFFPIASRYRKVFSGSGIYGVEGNIEIGDMLYASLGGDYYRENSHTTGTPRSSCWVEFIRSFTGLKVIGFPDYPVRPYFTGAFQVAYVKNVNHSPLLIPKETHWRPGALFELGVLYKWDHIVFDLFANYSWLTVSMTGSKTQRIIVRTQDISGFTLGGGVGYQF